MSRQGNPLSSSSSSHSSGGRRRRRRGGHGSSSTGTLSTVPLTTSSYGLNNLFGETSSGGRRRKRGGSSSYGTASQGPSSSGSSAYGTAMSSLTGPSSSGSSAYGTAMSSLTGPSSGGSRRKHRGGNSAWKFVSDAVGSGTTQWNNVFVKGGPFGGQLQNVSGSQPSSNAMDAVLSGKAGSMLSGQKGGKRRTKKGGYWATVINQALVPFGLWAAQNKFSRRKGVSNNHKSRRHR